jgi:hypothetical protein
MAKKLLFKIDPGSEVKGTGAGYVVVTTTPDHPGKKMKDHKKTYVYKHNVIMENYIGRVLRPEKGEEVHHKDGNPANNALSNLELSSKEEHPRGHALSDNPFWKKSPLNKPKRKHKKAMVRDILAKFLASN